MTVKDIKFPILIMCDRHGHAEMLISAIKMILGQPRPDLFHVRRLEKKEKWDQSIFSEANCVIKVGVHNECQYIVDISY